MPTRDAAGERQRARAGPGSRRLARRCVERVAQAALQSFDRRPHSGRTRSSRSAALRGVTVAAVLAVRARPRGSHRTRAGRARRRSWTQLRRPRYVDRLTQANTKTETYCRYRRISPRSRRNDMAIVRWEPLRELSTLQNEMNRLFSTVVRHARDRPATRCAAGCRRWTWSRPKTTSFCAPTCRA